MLVNTTTSFSRPRRLAAILLLIAPLAGCGAHWDMSWNESGRACHTGGYRGSGATVYADGDPLGAAIVLGIVGIAWGIGELYEAIASR